VKYLSHLLLPNWKVFDSFKIWKNKYQQLTTICQLTHHGIMYQSTKVIYYTTQNNLIHSIKKSITLFSRRWWQTPYFPCLKDWIQLLKAPPLELLEINVLNQVMLKQEGVSFIYLLHINLEIVRKSQNTLPTNEKTTHDNTRQVSLLLPICDHWFDLNKVYMQLWNPPQVSCINIKKFIMFNFNHLNCQDVLLDFIIQNKLYCKIYDEQITH
jgi:hypothetical protein